MGVRILHTSDLHLTRGRRRALLRFDEPFDLWVDTGDFLPNFGRQPSTHFTIEPSREVSYQARWAELANLGNRIADWLAGRPVLSVPGNHCFYTLADLMRRIGYLSVFEASPEGGEVFGVRVAGFREVPFEEGEWPGEVAEPVLEELSRRALASAPQLLVTHAPPAGLLDDARDHVGIPGLLDAIESAAAPPSLHLFGHVHATGGQSRRRGATHFVNGATRMQVLEFEP